MNRELWWFYFQKLLNAELLQENLLSFLKLRLSDPFGVSLLDHRLADYFSVFSDDIKSWQFLSEFKNKYFQTAQQIPFVLLIVDEEDSVFWKLADQVIWQGEDLEFVPPKYRNKIREIFLSSSDNFNFFLPRLKTLKADIREEAPTVPNLQKLISSKAETFRLVAKQNPQLELSNLIFRGVEFPPALPGLFPFLRKLEIPLNFASDDVIDLRDSKRLEELKLFREAETPKQLQLLIPNSLQKLCLNLAGEARELEISCDFQGHLEVEKTSYTKGSLLTFLSKYSLRKFTMKVESYDQLQNNQVRFNPEAIASTTSICFKGQPVLVGILSSDYLSLEPLQNVRKLEQVPNSLMYLIAESYKLPDLRFLSIEVGRENFPEQDEEYFIPTESRRNDQNVWPGVLQLELRNPWIQPWDLFELEQILLLLPNLEDIQIASPDTEASRTAWNLLNLQELCPRLKRLQFQEILTVAEDLASDSEE
jgi:hypothetical protein